MFFLSNKIIPKDKIPYIYELVKNIIAPGNRALMSPSIENEIIKILNSRLPENWADDSERDFREKISRSFGNKNFSTYADKYFPDYYAAYYVPNNIYKIQLMLLDMFKVGQINLSEKKIKVLDIGSAVGTSALALYDSYEILTNVLQLYGINHDLPEMEIDSLEKYQSNIDFFNCLREIYDKKSKTFKINEPINADVLNGGLDKVKLNNYDLIIASNIINEFPSDNHRLDFAKKIVINMKKDCAFIIVETAQMKNTKPLKKIQYNLYKDNLAQTLSPCGKINGFSDRCNDCYSFRIENLKIPSTMKIFSYSDMDESDQNERLKWSYAAFTKKKSLRSPISDEQQSLE